MLPGIVPRTRRLFASGFGYLAFLMASIYGIVRLLPANHPYLNPNNIGLFGVRHVVGEAANNLVISRKNIDQIIIFFALIAGIVILLLQMGLLAYGYIIQPALAQSLFAITDAQAERDIAYMLLDRVFGIPDMFNSCVALSTVCTEGHASETGPFPTPFHTALHGLFRFYSLGLLLVAALIFLYFVVIIIGETAVTGTPFGQRFQNVWVPIRLVVALGLLVPINYGLNTGQYITLFAAKAGSNFATNGWLRFNSTLDNPMGEEETKLAIPRAADLTPTASFMGLVHGCAYAYWHMDTRKNPVGGGQVPFYLEPQMQSISAYMVKNVLPGMGGNTADYQEFLTSTSYEDALNFYNNGDILIRFGIRNTTDEKFKKFKGNVEPTCGEIKIKIGDLAHLNTGIGPDHMQQYYFNLIKYMWFAGGGPGDTSISLMQFSQRFMAVALPRYEFENGTTIQCTICGDGLPACGGADAPCNNTQISTVPKDTVVLDFQADSEQAKTQAWQSYSALASDTSLIEERGWGGAGIWYNQINVLNGSFVDSVINIPSVVSYPILMEKTRKERLTHDNTVSGTDQFDPYLSEGQKIDLKDNTYASDSSIAIAKALADYYTYWYKDGGNTMFPDKQVTGDVFKDVMNFVFGTNGLMAIRGENAFIHPLAQLTAVGKGLVDSAVINVLASTLSSTGLFDPLFGNAGKKITPFIMSTAFIGLTAGFVLFYVLPFLPFVYFFFAVGAWVKSIFEAMVGVPLWALAHLRIDGEGLPGDSAANGYFLIFEIFIRPILTVFGLVASVLIFTAQVRVLNFIWPLVIDNVSGYSGYQDTTVKILYVVTIQRDIVDQFFFTVLYTIICYMLATASFKLIDSIPDNILRWMGAGVSSFGDINDDPTQGLTRYAAIGGLTFGQKLTGSMQEAAGGIGQLVKAEGDKLGGILGSVGKSGPPKL